MSEFKEAGFEIHGRFYPMPAAFRLGDPVLVEELTGLKFEEFGARLDEQSESARSGMPEPDAVLMPGLIGVAVWQANPRWSREKVARFVQSIAIEAVTFHAGEESELAELEEDDQQRPPDESSSTGSPTSTPPPEDND